MNYKILFGAIAVFITLSLSSLSIESSANSITSPYLLIGGERGTWFTPNQYPMFYQMSVSNTSKMVDLTPTLREGTGTIWTGGWNGSQWLISGFGNSSNNQGFVGPQMFLYDHS